MNLIGILDLFPLLFTMVVFSIILIRWKHQFSLHSKIFLIFTLSAIIFYYLSNFLEWSGISDILVDIEDYIAILVPLLWFFFLYSFFQMLSSKDLKASETKFKVIAEQSSMGIIIIQKGKFKYLNPAISEIIGYSREEMVKWTEKEIAEVIPKEDLMIVMDLFNKGKEGELNFTPNSSFRTINKNGQVKWLENLVSIISYENKPANLVCVIDITDKKKIEELIIEENRKLLELNKMRKDIITRVSHELKTPITAMYGATQLLLNQFREDMDLEILKFTEISHRGALRLKKLVDNLVDVTKLETGKIELIVKNENLSNLIKECIEEMNFLAANRNLKITFKLSNNISISVDKYRIQQVITNILSNAIKNTPKGGNIDITVFEKEEHIDIKIKDSGIGITNKEKELLFEKFGKIERYGMDLGVNIEGSGLGLYISKEIVDLHGGEILVESEGRHKGSTFTIRLKKYE